MHLLETSSPATKPVAVATPRLRDKTQRDIKWMNAHLAGLLANKQNVRVTYTFDLSDGGIRRFIPALVVSIAQN